MDDETPTEGVLIYKTGKQPRSTGIRITRNLPSSFVITKWLKENVGTTLPVRWRRAEAAPLADIMKPQRKRGKSMANKGS